MSQPTSTPPARLTFFSIPKAFTGHTGTIQMNAIRSWSRIPGAEVILFGDDPGVGDAAALLGARHEPRLERNALGTPLVSDAFIRAGQLASHPVLAYTNADIMYTSDVIPCVSALMRTLPGAWLAVGRRHDIDIADPVDIERTGEAEFRRHVLDRATLHGLAGMDYFIYPRDFTIEWPPLAVGRPGWDSWLIYAARSAGASLVDATGALLAVHQNHPPAYTSTGSEAHSNRMASGGFYRMGTMRDATWRAEIVDGAVRLARRPFGHLMASPPFRAMLAAKRFISWHRDRRT